ncbi:MAG: efflux RND transporter permease subunit [Candidatus Omnitrophica bacterium]|nr:efflux RND transporter permease subunit [Candidatus Omnitrophota bacterium]MDD5487905.1 efflux RND transporter permease subunit [Candidatus Omnitrophota bacterium]
MIEFFVKRPVTTIMFVLFFVILGLVSYLEIPIEADPKIDFPIITIKVEYPGATPLEVETQVINEIEDAVSEISSIEKIQSDSYENFGYVYVQFFLGTDVNIKSIEVKDKVEGILNDLPDSIEKPIIEKYDPLMEPVMDLVLISDKYNSRDLYEYADKVLKAKISSMEGVAKVDIYGGKERQINIVADPALMRQNYITIYDIVEKVKATNSNVPSGLLEEKNTSTSVRFVGEFEDVDAIRDMMITSRDGVSLKIGNVADVEDGFKKVDTYARFNGKDVVGLSVKKVSDGNAVQISRDIRKKFPEFNKSLPDGMSLEIANDTTDVIIEETNDTINNIFIGILLTVIILFIFTGRAKITFIAAVVIPTSLISTMMLVSGSGFTINSMTLLAIATCLGTLIANAIVIVENVLKHLEKGDDPRQAAVSGTKEVAVAVLAATGTNLVVFTPIAMMGGIVGEFMRSFGLTVVYATIFSLINSFTLTPMLCGLLMRKEPGLGASTGKGFFRPVMWVVKGVDAVVEAMKRAYKEIFDATMKYPGRTILSMFILFWALRFIMPFIDNEFMPTYDQDEVNISVVMPQGSTVDKTLGVAEIIERRVEQIPEMESYLTNIGENGVENCNVKISLVPLSERKRSDNDIINELLPFMADIPDAEIDVTRSARWDADVSINVFGDDYDKLITYSERMKDILLGTGYFRAIVSSYKNPKKEIKFIPDQKKLTTYGVSNSQVGYMLRAAIYGDDSNTYKEKGEEYKINVELDEDYAETLQDISQIDVITKKGMIPITELGDIVYDKAVPQIKHRDRERVIRLDGTLGKGALGLVREVADVEFAKLGLPEGYGYKFVEMAEHQDESGQEIGKAFLLAVILTFMLLCAILDSMTRPISIIVSIATSFIGVFLMFFFFGISINIASMLAIIMLVGLVVNNSILLLDFTILKIEEGVELKEALWFGASEKFKAILMTSIAIILGVVPQLYMISPLKYSMAGVIIGGMTASIIFTFLYTPVIFYSTEKAVKFISKRRKKTNVG